MSKEHAYAYEAGYRDGSVNYELEHCPACKNVADLQEALDENAELRKDIRDLDVCCQILSNRADGYFSWAVQIDVENDKLRKLCADLYAEMITYSDAPNYNASVWIPKLRKLGIEVD